MSKTAYSKVDLSCSIFDSDNRFHPSRAHKFQLKFILKVAIHLPEMKLVNAHAFTLDIPCPKGEAARELQSSLPRWEASWANPNSLGGYLRRLVFWILTSRAGNENLLEYIIQDVTGNFAIEIIIAFTSIADDHGTILNHHYSEM